GPSWHGIIGGLDYVGLDGVGMDAQTGAAVPHLAFMAYQCMFAVITTALISRAYAGRLRFSADVLFTFAGGTVASGPTAPLGVGRGRGGVGQGPGRDRVRGGEGRPSVVGHRGARVRDRDRQAPRLSDGSPSAARSDDDGDRSRHSVVRLVRVQRRLGAGRRRQ